MITVRFPFSLLVIVLVAGVASAGCVERRLLVRSNPPGALLKIDDEEIGITPVSTSFVYYGTRKIQLVKDGYETLTLLQPIPAPWYEWPGVDLVSEHLTPGQVRDMRVLDYQLQPAAMVPTEQLLERGNQLRNNAKAGVPPAPPELVPAPGQPPAAFPSAAPLPAPTPNLPLPPPPAGPVIPGAPIPNTPGAWPPLLQPLPR